MSVQEAIAQTSVAANALPVDKQPEKTLKASFKANDARKEFCEEEKETLDLNQEVVGLKQQLKVANDQCVLLFNEVQKAWKLSFKLQSDLKAENIMLAEKHTIEQDENNDLRNQVAPLLQQVQDQKLQLQQGDSPIESLHWTK